MARELYPGKSNSLDALCRRLEVDNSNRTLHGALLDAGLLADVYICMTRGQGTLVIEEAEAGDGAAAGETIDLSVFRVAAERARRRGDRRALARARGHRQGQWRQAAVARGHGIIRGSSGQRCAQPVRAVSSAVEHCLHTAGVAGSNPAPPTKRSTTDSAFGRRSHSRCQRRPLFRRYSITLSACSSSDGGITSPRARAADWLITSSKRLGCSTGRSPGLAPRRMRSTCRATWRSSSRGVVP